MMVSAIYIISAVINPAQENVSLAYETNSYSDIKAILHVQFINSLAGEPVHLLTLESLTFGGNKDIEM